MTDRAAYWSAVVRGDARGVGPAAVRAGLWWARLPYAAAVWGRNRAFDRGWKAAHRAGVPVVSVGNLSVGGTGKTPCVEAVAGMLRDDGRQVAILSRGYGAAAGPNDEALVLEDNLPDVPHLQGLDRVALARTAVEELEFDVLVLDDGFQHRRLHRDLDVVLLDATRPVDCDYVFPRGLLREPASELRRAGLLVITRCDQAGAAEVTRQRDWLRRRFPNTPVCETVHAPLGLIGADGRTEPAEALRGRMVGGFCGLGHPAAFRRTLEDLGATVAAFRSFADHHPYTRADVDDLRRWADRLPADAVVATTQKDWVKLRLPDLAGRPVRAVRVGLRFVAGEDVFRQRLQDATTGG